MSRPHISKYNPDPEYLRRLVEASGWSIAQISRDLGLDYRLLRRYLNGERPFRYDLQFTVESLVAAPPPADMPRLGRPRKVKD